MRRKVKLLIAASAAMLMAPVQANAPVPSQEAQQAAYVKAMQSMLKNQHPQKGEVPVPGTKATLHLGEKYYFLNAAESKKVLVDAWGNPPDVAANVLGMVFPAGKTFLDPDSWGAVLTYESSGYVSDEDAKSTDYDDLMDQMKSGDAEINAKRKEEGYDEQHLIGWAERPNYNSAKHSVVWAQNIKFGNQTDNSLNYDVRILGRYGVLSVNLLSSMSKLAEIKTAATDLSAAVTFDNGARYADFNASTDQVAEYGVGGLVAAGIGLAAAKKLGLLAGILLFAKKFFVFIFLGLGAAWRYVRRLFGGNDDDVLEAPHE